MSLLRKNDIVRVISGKDKGKKGKVLTVFPRKDSILVEGVNMAKRHQRRRRQEEQSGIVSLEKPFRLSKVQYFCNRCNRPVRLGVKRSTDGSGVRFCKRCKEDLT